MKSHPHRNGAGRRGHERGPHADRKLHQLCSQVERTLNYLLSGECDDDLLREFYVESVRPFPDEGHLLVTVAPLLAGTPVDPVRVLERLFVHHEMLRAEVASAIHRRRTPDWRYHVSELPPAAPSMPAAIRSEADFDEPLEASEAAELDPDDHWKHGPAEGAQLEVDDFDEDDDGGDGEDEVDPVEEARRAGRWPFAKRRGGARPSQDE